MGQCAAINLGKGVGFSGLDMVKDFKAASDKPITCQVKLRRLGDKAACYAEPTQA